jgi:hypothetical protein
MRVRIRIIRFAHAITRTGRGVPLLSYPSASAPSPAMFVFVSHFPRIRIRTAAAGQLARGRPLPRSCTAAMRYESERPHPGPALAGRSRRVPRARSVLARAVSAATQPGSLTSPDADRCPPLPGEMRSWHAPVSRTDDTSRVVLVRWRIAKGGERPSRCSIAEICPQPTHPAELLFTEAGRMPVVFLPFSRDANANAGPIVRVRPKNEVGKRERERNLIQLLQHVRRDRRNGEKN